MADAERLHRLADLAATLTDLPVDEQFRKLFEEGLTLADLNWENWRTDRQETIIPVRKVLPGARYES